MTGSMRTFVTERRGEERERTEAILKDQSVGPKMRRHKEHEFPFRFSFH